MSKVDDFEQLAREISLCQAKVAEVLETLHGREEVTLRMWSVLKDIDRLGPQTVPALVSVSALALPRQTVLRVVNELVEWRWVRYIGISRATQARPVELTRAGRRQLERIKKRESAFVKRLPRTQSAVALRALAAGLASFRTVLDRLSP